MTIAVERLSGSELPSVPDSLEASGSLAAPGTCASHGGVVVERGREETLQDHRQAWAEQVRTAYDLAGRPPYPQLAKRSDVSVSTISRMLAGKVLPRYLAMYNVLNELHRLGGMDAQTRDWLERQWAHIDGGLLGAEPIRAERRAVEHDPSRPFECATCGALVRNRSTHEVWHRDINRQLRLAADHRH